MAQYNPGQNALINQAIQFATMAHGNQTRKGNILVPYIFHPFDVANEVIRFSGLPQEEALIACVIAILHDTIEDTAVTYGNVLDQFGLEIADGVQLLSKDESVPKADQLTENLDRLENGPRAPQVVKLADRGSNLKTFPAMWSREKIGQYLDESILISKRLGNSSETLNAHLLMRVSQNRDRLSLFESAS